MPQQPGSTSDWKEMAAAMGKEGGKKVRKLGKWSEEQLEKAKEKIDEIYEPSQGEGVPLIEYNDELPDEVYQNAERDPADENAIPIIDVKKLGRFIDGWADLVEGMGDKEEEVRNKLLTNLLDRNIPDARITKASATVELDTKRETRQCLMIKKYPGIMTVIFTNKHGDDLYTCWRTFVQRVLNAATILAIVVISLVVGAFLEAIDFLGSGIFSGRYYDDFNFDGWMVFSLLLVVFICLFLVTLGRFRRGDPYAYFLIETSLFDSDNIGALNMTVHKTLFRTLDNSGIDINNLRLKRDFKGGRRDENF